MKKRDLPANTHYKHKDAQTTSAARAHYPPSLKMKKSMTASLCLPSPQERIFALMNDAKVELMTKAQTDAIFGHAKSGIVTEKNGQMLGLFGN